MCARAFRITHVISIFPASQLHFLANRNPEQNCINIGAHVTLLSGPTVHSLYCDHDLIFVIRKQRLPNPKAKTIEFRTTKNLDVNSFVKDLEEISWDSAYAYDNIDDIWHHWATLFNQILDKHVPLVQKKIGNRQIPWITAQIRKKIRKRNQLYKKFRKNSTNMNWIKYKEQRNL